MSILNKKDEMLIAITKTNSLKELEDLRINYLGKSGLLTLAIKEKFWRKLEFFEK